MQLPFTKEAFLNVFRSYNDKIWPLQFLFYLLAFSALYLVVKKSKWSNKLISIILAFFWLWMGVVYHLTFFSAINKAAYFFGSIFIVEGLLTLFYGVYRSELSFQYTKDAYGITGLVMVIFSLFIYPLIGYSLGHKYPYTPGFGVPCPTTIFTLGLLLWTSKKQNGVILVIPLLWSIIGFTAVLTLGIYEDTALLGSGLTAFWMLRVNRKVHAW